ncbi:histidine ammonia-lyase [Halopiger goleimassiliensis]|uniref:histidine ammonia-lyase n=1 Tax=Halopiger goleimassiliensis TaxID=1293048 RepID=UPI0006777626|nr:histidine ammonia-lyase [Halopiger goleimassiliensis]
MSNEHSGGPNAVVIDGETLSPTDVERVAREDAPVRVPERAREAVRESRDRVLEVLEADEAVYGVNTGFGELVNERIGRGDLELLQENLVRSHAVGVGRELEREEVRALLVTRLNALVKGYSGVRETVIDHLVELLNAGVHPVVPSRGSLGASGDLAPLAHAALVLLGEGEACVANGDDGDRLPGEEALARAGLEPLSLEPKEGLALINGTQLTVGLAALFVRDAERLLDAADVAGALTIEVAMGSTVPADPVVSAVRPHPGQAISARNVRRLTADSSIVASHRNCDRVQDAYSLRCLPQVHGAAREAVAHLRSAVEVELNSATDNPLVVPAEDVDPRATVTDRAAVLSAGNFHGEPLSLKLDYATAALTELAAIGERRVDRILNPNVQESHLPPFLAGRSGLESGAMIGQYTAAALVNELRSEGRPATDNATVSGGQEDHVSMSATSALTARRVVDRATTVTAIELLCASEAAEYVDDDLEHGVGTGAAYDAVRTVVDPLEGDRPLSADVHALADYVGSGALRDRVDEALPEGLVSNDDAGAA